MVERANRARSWNLIQGAMTPWSPEEISALVLGFAPSQGQSEPRCFAPFQNLEWSKTPPLFAFSIQYVAACRLGAASQPSFRGGRHLPPLCTSAQACHRLSLLRGPEEGPGLGSDPGGGGGGGGSCHACIALQNSWVVLYRPAHLDPCLGFPNYLHSHIKSKHSFWPLYKSQVFVKPKSTLLSLGCNVASVYYLFIYLFLKELRIIVTYVCFFPLR